MLFNEINEKVFKIFFYNPKLYSDNYDKNFQKTYSNKILTDQILTNVNIFVSQWYFLEGECPRSVMVKALGSGIVVNELEFQ